MNEFTVEDLKRTVGACLGTETAEELSEASLDVELAELGYDSLSVYEFVTKLQDDLTIVVTDEEIDELKTPRAVVELVNQRLRQSVGRP